MIAKLERAQRTTSQNIDKQETTTEWEHQVLIWVDA